MRTNRSRGLIKLIKDNVQKPILCGMEIGVAAGDTSVELLKAFPDMILTCVDIWDISRWNYSMEKLKVTQEGMDKIRARFLEQTAPYANRVYLLEMTSQQAARFLSNEMVVYDFIFHDADHSYPAVSADLPAFWDLLRDGGLYVGHDYGGFQARTVNWGVKRAVDEFALKIGRKVNPVRNPDRLWWWVK